MNKAHDKPAYAEILKDLQTCFPAPKSNPIMDGYFVHTISHFLDRVDSLKCAAPVLGIDQARCACSASAPSSCTLHQVGPQMLPKMAEFEHSEVYSFPESMSTVEEVTEALADYCRGMTIWAHPSTQVNVIPPSTIPSITAFIAASIYNPNIIWDEYSARFAEAEMQSVAAASDLVGYDPQRSGGLFTFGGTGTILYGCKLGLEKVLGKTAMENGVREDVKIVASDSSHYSKLNVAGWLGIGMRNVVGIPTSQENQILLPELERYLRGAFQSGSKVAAIIATMGTTDAFGIDDLASIVKLRDELAQEFSLENPPHVHADAVIGWAWSAFRDYEFDANPLGFHERTLSALRDSVQRIGSLHMADSIGIDFHNTGYAPYISSLFIARDREDLSILSRAPEQMPYLYQFGHYHPGIYSMECSRTGAGALAALANMMLLGKQGYRVLIGHLVEMAQMLRQRLEAYDFIKILNDRNFGPVTLFRVYPEGVNAKKTYQRELKDPSFSKELSENSIYNQAIFGRIHDQAMRGEGVLLSWTDAYRHADYQNGAPIAAVKSFIMSPWTDLSAVDMVVRQVLEAREMMMSAR